MTLLYNPCWPGNLLCSPAWPENLWRSVRFFPSCLYLLSFDNNQEPTLDFIKTPFWHIQCNYNSKISVQSLHVSLLSPSLQTVFMLAYSLICEEIFSAKCIYKTLIQSLKGYIHMATLLYVVGVRNHTESQLRARGNYTILQSTLFYAMGRTVAFDTCVFKEEALSLIQKKKWGQLARTKKREEQVACNRVAFIIRNSFQMTTTFCHLVSLS